MDKLRAQTWLTAAESHAAVCGYEIKLVDARLGIQFLRPILSETTAVAQRLRVKTIAATKRTTVERHKRGDTIAVGRKAMPCNAYYLSRLYLHGIITCNQANLQQIINIIYNKHHIMTKNLHLPHHAKIQVCVLWQKRRKGCRLALSIQSGQG